MRGLVLLCVLGACSDDKPSGPIVAHVSHYDYSFDIDSRVAHTIVTLEVEQPGDCITLPMRAPLKALPTIEGSEVDAIVDTDKVTFCGEGYERGSTIELGADVEIPLAVLGSSQVGYSITKDPQGNPFYYLVSWVNGCDQFGPCDNRPDQFARYTFNVTHPATFKARCPGTITEVSETQTRCDFELPGGPTYSTFGVAAYPAWTETSKGQWGGVDVTLYDRSATMIDAAIDPTYHDGFMTWMQSLFGPYPYGSELRVLTAPTYWGGFEHPGNIVLSDALAHSATRYWSETAHTLDHEMTHMWAGNQTTLASTYDFVWKEAMAEYLPYVWEDMQSPAYGTKSAGAWKSFAVTAKYFPVPLDQPELFAYYSDVYGPGPMVLFRQLEVLTSREAVLTALQHVLGTPGSLSVDALLGELETSTGLSLAGYADGWIRGTGAPGWPRYNVTWTAGATPGTSGHLVLTQVNKRPQPRGCKFHVALQGAQTTDIQLVEVNTFANGEDQDLAVPTPAFTVTKLVLDPAAECLVYAMTTSPRLLSPFNEPVDNPWRHHR